MNDATKATLIEYLAIQDKSNKLRELLIEAMTLDELIHAGLQALAEIKYVRIVGCSYVQAHHTMKARKDTIVDKSLCKYYSRG